jgi:outer membrane protein insertion porin family
MNIKINKYFFLTLLLLVNTYTALAQADTTGTNEVFILDYKKPKIFTIEAVEIVGTSFLDKNIIRSLSGLKIGDKISVPGDDISKAIKSLWKQGLFGDIQIQASKIIEDKIYLDIVVLEKTKTQYHYNKWHQKRRKRRCCQKIRRIKSKANY